MPGITLSTKDTSVNGDPVLKELAVSWGKGDKGRSTNKHVGLISLIDVTEWGPTFCLSSGPCAVMTREASQSGGLRIAN